MKGKDFYIGRATYIEALKQKQVYTELLEGEITPFSKRLYKRALPRLNATIAQYRKQLLTMPSATRTMAKKPAAESNDFLFSPDDREQSKALG